MDADKQEQLRALLVSEMVSRITIAEAVNIMHNIAISEVGKNIEQMSDEEKESALEELTKRVEPTEENEVKTED
jgi:hypothetical protein